MIGVGEFFLVEGARDQEFRDIADQVFLFLVRNLRGRRPDRMKDSFLPDVVAEYDVFDMLDLGMEASAAEHCKRLKLKFRSSSTRKDFAEFQRGHNYDYITIFFRTPTERTLEEWEAIVTKNADMLLKKNHESFIHEVIHMVDSHRYADPVGYMTKYSSTGEESEQQEDDFESFAKETNTPHETNAHFQAAFSAVSREIRLKRMQTWEEVQAAYGRTPGEFVNNVWREMEPVSGYFDADSRRKFVKRATQFYDTLKAKFNK